MTPHAFRSLIEGVLGVWQAGALAQFDDEGSACRIVRAQQTIATMRREQGPLGAVWRIERPGHNDRVHRSVVPALVTLREVLCPQRPRGRALFVAAPGGTHGTGT